MRQPASAGRLSRVLRQFAAVISIAFAGAVMAPGALAHDQLLSSDPANGATVKTAPRTMVLMFSAELKAIGTTVVLKDAEGKTYDAAPSVSGQNLTVGVGSELPAGEYTLEWRVVSSDGHPIEGTAANLQAVTFTVAGGTSPSAAASSKAPAAATATVTASASAPANAAATQAASSESNNPVQEAAQNSGISPWLIGAIAAVAVIAAVATIIAKNRKRN